MPHCEHRSEIGRRLHLDFGRARAAGSRGHILYMRGERRRVAPAVPPEFGGSSRLAHAFDAAVRRIFGLQARRPHSDTRKLRLASKPNHELPESVYAQHHTMPKAVLSWFTQVVRGDRSALSPTAHDVWYELTSRMRFRWLLALEICLELLLIVAFALLLWGVDAIECRVRDDMRCSPFTFKLLTSLTTVRLNTDRIYGWPSDSTPSSATEVYSSLSS